MKKYTISLAFLAAVLGSYGCHKEDSTPTEETLIVPVVKSIEATRASAADKAEQLLFSVPVKSDAGEEYTLEAWISDTECGMPETKGIPTTKDNLQSFKTKAYCNDLSVYSGMKEATATKNGEGWSYDKTYKWPAAEYCPLTFCSYAPGDLDITLKSATKASFPYTVSSTDAQSQKDLLFAMNNQGPGSDGTVKINFNHALTAVKFIKGEISNCTISSISLVNFHDSGTAECENGNLTWTAGTSTINYTQSFNTNVDDLGDGESLDLDKDHESRTFMVIPQKLPNSAKIEISLGSSTITYDVGSATDTKVKDWSSYAGKTVTFKVNKKEFDVVIVMDSSTSMLSDCSSTTWTGRTDVTDYTKRMVVQRYAILKLLNEINQTGVNVSLISFAQKYDSKITISNKNVSGWTVPEAGLTYTDGKEKIFTNTVVIKHLTDVTSVFDDMTKLLEYKSFKAANSSYAGSCPYLGLQLAYYELVVKSTRSGAKKKVIFISDGYPTTKETAESQDDGAGYNGNYVKFNDASKNVSNIANWTIDAGNGVEQKYNYGNYFYYTAKQIKNLASTEIYTLFTGSGSFATNTKDSKYYNCRQFLSAISSDKPTAATYDKGDTTLASEVKSGTYAYTLYNQNLDTFIPALAKIILE